MQNGDALDLALSDGLSFAQAVIFVRDKIQPHCLSCGGLIYRGTPNKTLFCSKHPQCRLATRRIQYFKIELNLPHQQALELTLKSLTLEKVA